MGDNAPPHRAKYASELSIRNSWEADGHVLWCLECYKLQYSALITGEISWCEHPHVGFAGKGSKECFEIL